MEILNRIRIKWLKFMGQRAYANLEYECSNYPCGMRLCQEINPRAYKWAKIFDDICDRLTEVDPSCPGFPPHLAIGNSK